jgi:hypothetical protein
MLVHGPEYLFSKELLGPEDEGEVVAADADAADTADFVGLCAAGDFGSAELDEGTACWSSACTCPTDCLEVAPRLGP